MGAVRCRFLTPRAMPGEAGEVSQPCSLASAPPPALAARNLRLQQTALADDAPPGLDCFWSRRTERGEEAGVLEIQGEQMSRRRDSGSPVPCIKRNDARTYRSAAVAAWKCRLRTRQPHTAADTAATRRCADDGRDAMRCRRLRRRRRRERGHRWRGR